MAFYSRMVIMMTLVGAHLCFISFFYACSLPIFVYIPFSIRFVIVHTDVVITVMHIRSHTILIVFCATVRQAGAVIVDHVDRFQFVLSFCDRSHLSVRSAVFTGCRNVLFSRRHFVCLLITSAKSNNTSSFFVLSFVQWRVSQVRSLIHIF
ncbi:uncharacterized protein DEA37_0008922 [Paragonimus westermani]|uniref:Uncharacterized protein n=1 Tax=Paragonimus westermani TaxID=34504 RepID=A0A5J4P1A1_9TREM|nr:uncharacterized protein DEA37_0008922 [Paragonimus westermani]